MKDVAPRFDQDAITGAQPPTRPRSVVSDAGTDESELRKAIELSLTSGDDFESEAIPAHVESPSANDDDIQHHGGKSPIEEGEASGVDRDKPPDCKICSGLPVFPYNRKTRKFRLYKPVNEFPDLLNSTPGSEGVCAHYVAVSYCWPEPIKDEDGNIVQPEIDSKVRDLNGEQRPARALDQVLDGAVDFANSFGLRMIWIDQECLPQPQPGEHPSEEEIEYKRLGVQAMDTVYNRAMATAGLHSVRITSQFQADAMLVMIAHGYNSNRPLPPSQQAMDSVLAFIEMVVSDRWYTRAWVVQEAVSAGLGLCLAFHKAPEIVFGAGLFRTRDTNLVPSHPVHNLRERWGSELLVLPVQNFRMMVRAVKKLLDPQFISRGQLLTRVIRVIPIIAAAESLHLGVTTQHHISAASFNLRIPSYGGRRKLDAATALTLLKSRGCRDVQDRITILANMCDYEIRLYTNEAVKHCDSLRIGLLSIALLNGDLSILVPEAYHFPGDDTGFPEEQEDRRTGGLLSPFDTDCNLLSNVVVQSGELPPVRVNRHTFGDTGRKGLPLSSYVWKVDETLDLWAIKTKYSRQWHTMKCLRILIERKKDESAADYFSRKELITEHFYKRENMMRAMDEIYYNGRVAPYSPVWGGMDSSGTDLEVELEANRVESEPKLRDSFATIVYAILMYLHDINTSQSRGVANSIWHSFRTGVVSSEESGPCGDLPDFVNDDPLDFRFRVLQLEKTRDGRYHQAWLIDRIMKDGFLWTGRYIRTKCRLPDPQELEAELSGWPELRTALPDPLELHEGVRKDTIIYRQLKKHLLAAQISPRWIAQSGSTGHTMTKRTVGGTVTFHDVLERGFWSTEAEDARERQLVSVFDVDGPCVVVTPFNVDWEVLPRPSIRSMSVCWVVEQIQDHTPEDATVPAVSGEGHLDRANRKGKEPERPKMSQGDSGAPSDKLWGEEDVMYRVVDKVKGVWQIMDLPVQVYSFL